MPVTFTVDAYEGTTFYGTVDAVRLNATTQNNVVTYPVWIKVMNDDLRLRPALTATVKIRTSSAPGVVRIPNAALRFRPTNDMYMALGPRAAGRANARTGRGRPRTWRRAGGARWQPARRAGGSTGPAQGGGDSR